MSYTHRGEGRSIRAQIAETQNRMPLTRAAKAAGIPVEIIKALIHTKEWHHVGKFANEVEYYDVEAIIEFFSDDHGQALMEDCKRSLKAKSASVETELVFENITVEWVEFVGPRSRPRAVEVKEEGAKVVYKKGAFVEITLKSGQVVKKSIDGKHLLLPGVVSKAIYEKRGAK